MSDFEVVTLFNDLLNTCFARLNDFMVGLFAMLVTAYLVARELTRPMAWLVLTLYTLFSVATIVPAILTAQRFALAGDLVRSRAIEPDSILCDLFPVLPSPGVVTTTISILLLAAYAGGIVFFIQARRRPRGPSVDSSGDLGRHS